MTPDFAPAFRIQLKGSNISPTIKGAKEGGGGRRELQQCRGGQAVKSF